MNNRRNTLDSLRRELEQFFQSDKRSSHTSEQLLEALGLLPQDKPALNGELKKMQGEGLLVRSGGGRYGLPERLGLTTGTLQGNRRGYAFLRPDRQSEDIYISSSNLNDAVHGDRVVVRVDPKAGRRRREGTVIGIIRRGRNKLIGTLYREKKRFYVIPDDSRFPGPVQVSPGNLKKAAPGNKVVVEIEKWPGGSRPGRGTIVDNIGPSGTALTARLTFAHRFELPGEFPEPVLGELELLPGEEAIPAVLEDRGRVDFRGLKMVTIDDETARDFDDAVSLELVEPDLYRLGVHIADVSHYVRGGKPLDREALKRGTSTYLVDRVIHMLPPQLSENLCSLKAGRDRLALSVTMDIDSAGEQVGFSIKPSVIRVAERLTYRGVESCLRGEKTKGLFSDGTMPGMLRRMDRLAAVLRRRRLERGALDLDLPEAHIEVDEAGVPVSVEKRFMGRAESLIEEFMIYCNETVAAYLSSRRQPCIFRVHASPTAEKLALLRETLSLMGIGAVSKTKVLKPKHLSGLLEKTRGEKAEKLVRYLVLRALPQARYSADNEGHFGLASQNYCHFTSPIRRYPDLVVHRIVKQQLASGALNREQLKKMQKRLPEIALHISERERAAVEAERASMDIMKAHYMESRVDEVYTGIISGVTGFGLFVELENTVEGMIPVNELKNDYYTYHEKQMALVGERTRKMYRLGDSMRIQVVRASREEGRVTFAPA